MQILPSLIFLPSFWLCVPVAYRADIFVLSSIVLSLAHELWRRLEVTKYSLKGRDTFIELWDMMDVY